MQIALAELYITVYNIIKDKILNKRKEEKKMENLNNTTEWFSREAVISHEDGYVAYATTWFNGSEVVAIEPHTAADNKTGEFYYYNRIMGKEVLEYKIDLYEEL